MPSTLMPFREETLPIKQGQGIDALYVLGSLAIFRYESGAPLR
jgi:hypothetical protein